jgi:hypothetical protein
MIEFHFEKKYFELKKSLVSEDIFKNYMADSLKIISIFFSYTILSWNCLRLSVWMLNDNDSIL